MFLGAKVTDWPSTFQADDDETVDVLASAYQDTVVAANRVIEETGRHAGHLDILRELADGSTGR
jgi:hypothetical protein